MIDTIWIQPSYGGREYLKLINSQREHKYTLSLGSSPFDRNRCAPVGDVPFCEELLGYRPVPDFYPEWLHSWMNRPYGRLDSVHAPSGSDWFVKSAVGYKDYPARVVKQNEEFPPAPLWYSRVVKFTQEWRYYVTDGCVLATGWYDGNNEDEPAPNLNIDWPKGFCGAVDFGRLSTGKIAIVESHHPYACGWYGDDHAAYAYWVVEGWKYMKGLTP